MSKKIAITVLWISTILLVESMNAQPYRHGAGEFSVPGKPNSKIKYTNDISITDGVDANGNPVQYLGIWLYVDNDINSNEEYDVIVCAMLQFENEKISPANYPYICKPEKKFAIIKERYLDNEGNPIIINGKSGSWKCIEIEVPTNQPVGTNLAVAQRARTVADGDGKCVVVRLADPALRRVVARPAPIPSMVALEILGPTALPGARLRALFGLSEAEAQLVGALVDGLTLKEIATRRGVAVTTVRSQLRSVFLKTETERQADLVALVLRVSA